MNVSGKVAEPAVKLFVTGLDRDWVELATNRLTERLDKGERATGRVSKMLTISFVVVAAAAIGISAGLGDNRAGLNAAEITGIVLGSVAGLLLLILVSLDTITPQLELVPEGGTTKWGRLWRRIDISGRWVLDAVVKAGIGALIVVLIEHSF